LTSPEKCAKSSLEIEYPFHSIRGVDFMRFHHLVAVTIAAACAAAPALAQDAGSAELEAKVDALASELNRLRESLSVPEDEQKKSRFGLGPAASKVYDNDGLSIGGYGELFMGHFLGDAEERKQHRGDTYRFIAYLGYKFDDMVVFNTEIEFEHADQAFVEFMYVDLLLAEWLNVRTGLMLTPMGIINEMHEPTTYRGNFRPETERRIIPSTWRQAGLGLLGHVGGGLNYKLYLVNGLRGENFDANGLRGGRQKGSQFLWEDKGVVARLDWSDGEMIDVGASVFYGGADHDPTETAEYTTMIYEAHAIARFGGAEIRALFAGSTIDGFDVTVDDPATEIDEGGPVVPTAQRGFYVEASYDLGPTLGFEQAGLSPFTRFERLDLQVEVPDGATVDDGKNSTRITVGLEYKPHPDVVFKGEFENVQTDAEDADPTQELRLGIGFIF